MKIVVAKYTEDISWINSMNEFNIFIINKNPEEYNIYDMDLPNVGRESHSYLSYIIKYYDELDDYTCFLQGRPFDHLRDINILDLIKSFKKDVDFIAFGNVFKETKTPPHYPEKVNYIFMEDIIHNIPESIIFNCGGQFIVSKKRIQKHPKEFYIKLLEKHYTFHSTPWTIERLWHVIFS